MIIIPARLGSTRFEKKVLSLIHGVPMVIATAKRVQEVDDVIIATDSLEVLEIAKKYNIKAVLTSTSHQSGTDRIYEATNILGLNDDEVILNVQADEPFIEPEVIQSLRDYMYKSRHKAWSMASCCKRINAKEASNPNLVKVVMSEKNSALYFSRATIPYIRDSEDGEYFGHLGVYGFNLQSLRTFCKLPPAWLEECEKLEQLRALAHGFSIQMIEVVSQSIGIDTQEDLIRALKLFPRK